MGLLKWTHLIQQSSPFSVKGKHMLIKKEETIAKSRIIKTAKIVNIIKIASPFCVILLTKPLPPNVCYLYT